MTPSIGNRTAMKTGDGFQQAPPLRKCERLYHGLAPSHKPNIINLILMNQRFVSM